MTTCYCPSPDGTIVVECGSGSQACGKDEPGYYNATSKVQLCCASGDTCGANSICRYDTYESGHPVGGSGFYLGGCTDPKFADPLCRNDCESRLPIQTEDIVYLPQLEVWSCCGHNASGAVNCSEPITQASFRTTWPAKDFPGPIGDTLEAAVTTTPTTNAPASSTTSTESTSIASLSQISSLSTATIASDIAPTLPSQSGLPSSPSSSSSGLSTGAKAGIGVGVSLGAIALIGLTTALVILWRRVAGKKQPSIEDEKLASKPSQETPPVESCSSPIHEANATPVRHEADGVPFKPITEHYPVELEQPIMRFELDGPDSEHRG